MKLLSVEEKLNLCKEHLKATKTKGTEIESILTKFLLVYICGEYEKIIKKMINSRVAQTGDKELESFVDKTVKMYRLLEIKDIRGSLLKKFSDNYVSKFDEVTKDRDEEKSRYNNIVGARHSVAHGMDINITFDELEDSYHKAGKILLAIKEALELNK
jgi:hypothetical protein